MKIIFTNFMSTLSSCFQMKTYRMKHVDKSPKSYSTIETSSTIINILKETSSIIVKETSFSHLSKEIWIWTKPFLVDLVNYSIMHGPKLILESKPKALAYAYSHIN